MPIRRCRTCELPSRERVVRRFGSVNVTRTCPLHVYAPSFTPLSIKHSDIYSYRRVCYCSTMITMTVRDANQYFSKMLAEVEKGETVLITKNGKTVAELRPRADDPRDVPEWRAAFDRMDALMKSWPDTGYRVGKITEDDKYDDAPL